MAGDDAWYGDKLGRKEEADALLLFLQGRLDERRRRGDKASYVLNVDSGWGHGKSYFLANIQKDLRANGASVALIDAWATDFSDDPLTAIMSEIEKALDPHLKTRTLNQAWQSVLKSGGSLAISLSKHVSSKLIARYAGDFGDDFYDEAFGTSPNGATEKDGEQERDALGLGAASEELIDKLADSALDRLITAFRKQEQSIATFKDQLAKLAMLLNKKSNKETFSPIYVLIDELDRCRPTYAIRMLESVKHLFNTHGIVFIIATDTEQLSESVKAIYGNNFESQRYLRRFFDRTYRFREPSYDGFVSYVLSRSGIDMQKLGCPSGLKPEAMASIILQDYGASLRDAEQCLDMLQTICTMWRHKVPIELGYALALICLYHSGRIEDYKILSGQSNDLSASPVFKRSSVILSIRTGGFNERSRIITSNTNELLAAYAEVHVRTLPKWAEHGASEKPAMRHVQSVMYAEFSTLFQNSYNAAKPPKSLLCQYHKYVELAERLGEDPHPDEGSLRTNR